MNTEDQIDLERRLKHAFYRIAKLEEAEKIIKTKHNIIADRLFDLEKRVDKPKCKICDDTGMAQDQDGPYPCPDCAKKCNHVYENQLQAEQRCIKCDECAPKTSCTCRAGFRIGDDLSCLFHFPHPKYPCPADPQPERTLEEKLIATVDSIYRIGLDMKLFAKIAEEHYRPLIEAEGVLRLTKSRMEGFQQGKEFATEELRKRAEYVTLFLDDKDRKYILDKLFNG